MTEKSSNRTPSITQSLISWTVSILVPIILLLTSIRIILIPGIIGLEYRMPGFPADQYGFTPQERVYWSRFAVDYLLNGQEISFLGDLKFEDGSPLFNERELDHMVDVQRVVSLAMTVWKFALDSLILLGIVSLVGNLQQSFREGLRRGGWMTLYLIFGILVFVSLAFGMLFVAFHNIFFEPGTWTFLWTDTLIRLFPERFWRDMFIYIGLMTAAFGLLLILRTSDFKHRNQT
jgi:integral membrane protein (TIGR01906 family)